MRHWSRLSAALAALLLLCAVPARGQSVGSPGTISTAGSDCSVATRCWGFKAEGVAAFGVGLNTGTSGTFNFEISTTASSVYDDTGDWTAVKDAENGATSGTADGIYFFGNTGFRWFRVRASAINGAAGLNANRGYVPLRSTATLTGGGSNAAASTTGSAVPSSAGYTAINVGGTLRGWTGLSLGSHYVPMIAISDGAGSQITSFGGGTQYQTAAAQATPTGTLALGYDGANLRHFLTDSGGRQAINLAYVGGSAAGAANPLFIRLSDGSAAITTLPVSLASVPSHAVTNAGTFAVQVSSALPSGTNNIGDVDVLSVPADPFGTNADAASSTGSFSAKLRLMSESLGAIELDTDTSRGYLLTLSQDMSYVRANLSQDADQDQTAKTKGPQIMAYASAADPADVGADGRAQAFWTDLKGRLHTRAQGNVGHDAIDAGDPVKVGGRAVAFGATPTAVAAADRFDWLGTRAGIPFVQPGHPNTISVECQVQDADGAQTDAACVSVSAGTKIVVTGVAANCDASTTAPTNVAVGFGTASLPSRAHTGAAGMLLGFDGVPAGGGRSKGFAGGVVGVGADDEDVRFTMEDPVGGACSVEVSYYTIAG